MRRYGHIERFKYDFIGLFFDQISRRSVDERNRRYYSKRMKQYCSVLSGFVILNGLQNFLISNYNIRDPFVRIRVGAFGLIITRLAKPILRSTSISLWLSISSMMTIIAGYMFLIEIRKVKKI